MKSIYDTVFTHFGDDRLSVDKFVEIKKNDYYCGGLKPRGGLWGSNENTGHIGWSKWVRTSEMDKDLLKSFNFKLKDDARVLVVTGTELLNSDCNILGGLPSQYKDWMKVKDEYDAVYIDAGSDKNLYFLYYGWDCDSILVLNIDSVEEVD